MVHREPDKEISKNVYTDSILYIKAILPILLIKR